MSAGFVHRKASIFLACGFLLGGIISLDINWLQYIFGALLGIFLTPDIDVDNGFIGDAMIRKYVGKWAESVWKIFWYWYRRSLKHGSPLSHFPIISTLGRLTYLFLWIIIIPEIILKYTVMSGLNIGYEISWYIDKIMIGYRIIIGLMASDLIHWTLDILTTEHKDIK